jgi:hypothetical protein
MDLVAEILEHRDCLRVAGTYLRFTDKYKTVFGVHQQEFRHIQMLGNAIATADINANLGIVNPITALMVRPGIVNPIRAHLIVVRATDQVLWGFVLLSKSFHIVFARLSQ